MHYCFDYISPELKSILEPATQQCHFTGEKLQVHEYPNGMIAPFVDWKKSIGGILSHDGTVIKDSECKEWKESDLYYSPANAKTEDKTVIFLGFMPRAFGHAFNDCLRKIWFINCDFCRCLLEEGAEFVYTAQENETLPSYFFETFRLAGFELSQARQITELTRFKSVIVPENCVIAEDDGRVYTNEYKQLIDNVVHSIPRAGEGTYPKRVYFTRTHIKSSKEQGEQAIEQQFKRLGYTIISPELYPVTTQIDIVRDLMDRLLMPGGVKIVDPAMADHGKLYYGFDQAFVEKMSELCTAADYILPNLTEACFLTGTPYRQGIREPEEIRALLEKLGALGPAAVVLKGISAADGKIGNAVYDVKSSSVRYYFTQRIEKNSHGTGDCFAAAFTGALMRGLDAFDAMALATDFVVECLRQTMMDPEHWYGISFERALPLLIRRLEKQS